jgi:trk system potassium uptake protein TrkH
MPPSGTWKHRPQFALTAVRAGVAATVIPMLLSSPGTPGLQDTHRLSDFTGYAIVPEDVKALSYAVRPKVVARYLGLLSTMLALLTLPSVFVSIIYGEYVYTERFMVVVVVLALLGLLSSRLEHSGDLQTNESLTISALVFALTPLLMSYPLMAGGLSFTDAWFEAISAITTTGLSTISNLDDKPHTFLFARAWMQWYGGLGIVVLSVALLMGHHAAIKRLVGASSEGVMTTTRIYAKRMLGVYTILSLAGFVLLWWLLGDLFLALTHSLAAISTGGFSTLNMSLAGIPDWTGRYAIMALGFIGALPLFLYYRIAHGKWREALNDPEPKALIILVVLLSILLSMTLKHELELSWHDSIAHAVLLSLSAQTTTGFTSLAIGKLGADSMALLIVSMFIGGGIGSTAGGIKLLRLVILFRLFHLLMQRSAMPSHAVTLPRIGVKLLGEDEIIRALLLIILYFAVTMISWFVFLVFGFEPMQSLFEVVSAIGTVGLSSGITSAELHPVLKAVLCVDMLLGRLEIIALLIIFYPPTWIGRRKE